MDEGEEEVEPDADGMGWDDEDGNILLLTMIEPWDDVDDDDEGKILRRWSSKMKKMAECMQNVYIGAMSERRT